MSLRIYPEDLRAVLAEFIGTAYFLFMGVGGAAAISAINSSLGVIAIPFAFGWSLFVNVWIWASISGGVLNPAITIALVVLRKKPLENPIRGVLYIIAQMAGALLGSFLVDVLLPNSANSAEIASTVLGSGVSTAQGFFLEFFATSVLTMAVINLAVGNEGGAMAPFGIGMSLFISAIAIGPYTGASLNPARTFGPSIVSGNYGKDNWIYYIGTILGSLLAAAYSALFKKLGHKTTAEKEKDEDVKGRDNEDSKNTKRDDLEAN